MASFSLKANILKHPSHTAQKFSTNSQETNPETPETRLDCITKHQRNKVNPQKKSLFLCIKKFLVRLPSQSLTNQQCKTQKKRGQNKTCTIIQPNI